MSTLRLINAQIGTSNTSNQNMTWYQPTVPDGTIRLGVGNAGATTKDMIIVSSSGVTLSNLTLADTPTQFDNSKLISTTEFIQKNGLKQNGVVNYTTSGTIPLTDLGKQITLNFTNPGALTLPTLASVPPGMVMLVSNWGNTSVTLNAVSGQNFKVSTTTPTSLTLTAGSSLILTAEHAASWNVIYTSNFTTAVNSNEIYVALTPGANVVPDANNNRMTLTPNTAGWTLKPPINPPATGYGKSFKIIINQGTTAYDWTVDTIYKQRGAGATPSLNQPLSTYSLLCDYITPTMIEYSVTKVG